MNTALITPPALRPYQQDTVDALWSALRRGVPAPLACLPTGAGKSLVVAELCRQAVLGWHARVLVLVHVRELVAQLAAAIRGTWPEVPCPLGVLSAGLGQRGIDRVTVAGIQSAFRRAVDLGRVDLVIVDECHLIPPAGDGMYRTLLGELRVINPKLKLIGLTATPYRLGHGLIAGPSAAIGTGAATESGTDGEPRVFSELVHDVPVRALIEAGFLSPLRGKDGGAPDLSRVHHRGGEFVASEVEAIMEDAERVRLAVAELLRHGAERKAWLVFACSVTHAGMVRDALVAAGVAAEAVTGETPDAVRDARIARFQAGGLRCLVNVQVLTTGFDAPHVDLVALLRPTESPGLYYQMVGRGFRRAPGKTDCLVLDLAGNIARHGPIETLNERIATPDAGGDPPTKTCPHCHEICHAGCGACPACGAPFMKVCAACGHDAVPWSAAGCPACGRAMIAVARHDTTAAEGDPLSGTQEPTWVEVDGIEYAAWTKRGAAPDAPRTLCVTYHAGWSVAAREWICVEHPPRSFAHGKALRWLAERFRPGWCVDEAADGWVLVAPNHRACWMNTANIAALAPRALRVPRRIALVPDGRFQKITAYEWDDDGSPDEDAAGDAARDAARAERRDGAPDDAYGGSGDDGHDGARSGSGDGSRGDARHGAGNGSGDGRRDCSRVFSPTGASADHSSITSLSAGPQHDLDDDEPPF